MRVVFKIMLGLLLFNAIFTLYNPIFNSGYGNQAVAHTDTEMENFDLLSMENMLSYVFTNANALLSLGVLGFLGLVASIFTKNPVFIGAGIFIGVITSMYISFSNIISQLGTQATGNNIYVTGIITIIGIAIGVLAMFNIVDMFAPAPAQ